MGEHGSEMFSNAGKLQCMHYTLTDPHSSCPQGRGQHNFHSLQQHDTIISEWVGEPMLVDITAPASIDS